jgi:predicted amidophosphoribosyltransferase
VTREELIGLTEAVAQELVPIPADGPDVCPVCRSGKAPTDAECWSCARVLRGVALPTRNVVPISYYTTPSPLRERMHDYKESEDPRVRTEQARVVAGILARYLLEHGDRLTEIYGDWDVVATVPSTKTDPPSALSQALDAHYRDLIPVHIELLAVGGGSIGRNAPSETGFRTVTEVEGMRVLLVDDTYTTGSHFQSAVHALRAAEAEVVAGLVVARKINPDALYHTNAVWERQVERSFDFRALPWWAISSMVQSSSATTNSGHAAVDASSKLVQTLCRHELNRTSPLVSRSVQYEPESWRGGEPWSSSMSAPW